MEAAFFKENRRTLYESLEEGTILLLFAGKAHLQSADAYYPFFSNRNFAYLTGLSGAETQNFVLMAQKTAAATEETLFLLPPDAMAERWTGRRIKPDEATAAGGIEKIAFVSEFENRLHRAVSGGAFHAAALDLCKNTPEEEPDAANRFAALLRTRYPELEIKNVHHQLACQRTIKKPCEIEAMRRAMKVTKAGIEAMMRASKPGMYEYEYKAVYDQALTSRGVLSPAFPSIISAGSNNFCIHYYSYTGQAKDGDMILNDVGACWDNECNDVSRGWPCNGKFSARQRELYACAYETSEHMFHLIRPGIPMADVDRIAHEYCGKKLEAIGLLRPGEDVGRYMWHGGAHHVGFDVHDAVDMTRPVAAGMVFCVDIGIYIEEWGIGFRLEDNCLVTENGCENLSREIPRSIEKIEQIMRKDARN